MLKLLSDVLVLPLGQVGDDDTRVKATCVGSHPQLLNGLFFEIQKTYIIILLGEKFMLIISAKNLDFVWQKLVKLFPTWFPAPRTMPLADAESQSSENAAACPVLTLVSYNSWMSPVEKKKSNIYLILLLKEHYIDAWEKSSEWNVAVQPALPCTMTSSSK